MTFMNAEQLAFIRAICTEPANDTPRLVYAGWLQENGEEDRAEFIRTQIAGGLATLRLTWLTPFEAFFGCQPHQCGRVAQKGAAWAHNLESNRRLTFTRGFVSAITCTAGDWLAHADALVWRSEQSKPCPECEGTRTIGDGGRRGDLGCPKCNSASSIPRPCPPTAQPIERVTLTTDPAELQWLHRIIGSKHEEWLVAGEWITRCDSDPLYSYLFAQRWPMVGFTFSVD